MELAFTLALAVGGLIVPPAVGGPDGPSQVPGLEQAAALHAAGRYFETEQLLRQALDSIDRAGQAHPQLPVILNNLGSVSQEIGRNVDAERFYRRAIQFYESSQDPAHPVLLKPLCNLASLYLDEGQPRKAERLYRRALQLRCAPELNGTDSLALPWHGLGMALHAQRKWAAAEDSYLRAVSMREATAGSSIQLAQTQANLAVLYLSSGRYSEALRRQLLALHALEKRFPPGHPELARPLANLGAIYSRMNRPLEAEPVLARALDIARAGFGSSHEICGGILSNYAEVLRQLNRKDDAKRMEILANAILESSESGKLGRHTVDFNDIAKPAGRKVSP
jgi:tetratricopeptide (TPR) repeat protein